MIRSFLLAGAVVTALFAQAPVKAQGALGEGQSASSRMSVPPIEYTMWTLENGLRVIAIPDPSTNTVTTSLWYEIGSKLDPEGRSGFAHLFEHILSRKTENMPYNMIYGLTADIGGTRNASNWIDRTNYFEQVPAAYLETMLWTHRERMANVVVDEEVFATEREVVKEELRQRVLAPPYGRLQRFVIPENAYDVMPHRRPGIGSIEDLDSATLDDALAFYEAYYGPDTATLIVAGNFQIGKLRDLVDRYFADIAPRANPVSLTVDVIEPELDEPRVVHATAPNVPLPVVGGIWKAPPVTHPDAAALEVLEAILARGGNSRLGNALVRSGQAVQVEASAQMFRDAGQFAAYAIVRDLAQLQLASATLNQEIEQIRAEPVSEDEIEEAKAEIIAASLIRRETARGRAFELGEALVSSGDPDFADKWLSRIAAVTSQDVLRVAELYLDPAKRVAFTYSIGPDSAQSYANPNPLPRYRSLPPAVGEVREVLPEGQRMPPPGPADAPAVEPPTIVQGTLDNGITVVAVQTGEVPIATMTMLVPGGSKTDRRELAGVADMAARLADSGFRDMDAAAIAARFESLGASFAGGSNSDGTSFSLTSPVSNLAETGSLAARIVRGATYPAAEFERERARAIDELRVLMQDPGRLARNVARAAIYGDAPYGSQSQGTAASLAAISRDDLLNYRRRYIHPERMQIVVSGGLDPQAAIEMVDAMFGDWSSDNLPGPLPEKPARHAGIPRSIVIDIPDADQAAVVLAVRAPSRTDEDFHALQLANSVLGGGSSGRLFEEVRTKRSLSYGAYSNFAARVDQSILLASAQTKNESASEVASIFLDQFARLGSEELNEDLLARRRLYLGGRHDRILETSAGLNGAVASLLQQGLTADETAFYPDRLAAVDAEAANQAARTYVNPEQATLVMVGDAAQFLDQIIALRGDVELIAIDDLDFDAPDLRKGPDS